MFAEASTHRLAPQHETGACHFVLAEQCCLHALRMSNDADVGCRKVCSQTLKRQALVAAILYYDATSCACLPTAFVCYVCVLLPVLSVYLFVKHHRQPILQARQTALAWLFAQS